MKPVPQKFPLPRKYRRSFSESAVVLTVVLIVFCFVSYLRWCGMRNERKMTSERLRNSSIQTVGEYIPEVPRIYHWGADVEPTKIFCKHGRTCDFSFGKNPIGDEDLALVFLGINAHIQNLPRRNPKVIWSLIHHESPKINMFLKYEKFLNLFNYSFTYSPNSDVPFPLQGLHYKNLTSTINFVSTSVKNSVQKEIAPILYLQSSCSDYLERDEYVETLRSHYIPVDSYGSCVINKLMPRYLRDAHYNKICDPELYGFFGRYKFVLAIENAVCEDYLTEKLWRTLEGGSVPIYFGATSVRDWLPNPKSAVLIEDYPTPVLLSEHLYALLANDTLYEEHLEHKTKGIIRNKRIKYELMVRSYQHCHTRTDTLLTAACFLCDRMHDRKQGKPLQTSVVTKNQLNCPNKDIRVLRPMSNPDLYGRSGVIDLHDEIMERLDWVVKF